ncbi:hypothetical protein LPJ61_005329, partial [Coemansia biformis]
PATTVIEPANAINYTCAFRITYRLISYVNTNQVSGGESGCGQSNSGSGYISGIGMFTTRYGSALAEIKNYANTTHYKGEFDNILPALTKVVADVSGSVDGLDGYCDAWKKAAENGKSFYNAQVKVVRDMYETPAIAAAKQLKIKLPLTRATMVMVAMSNGVGEDGSTIGAIIKNTNAKFTGDVKGSSGYTLKVGSHRVDEIEWLKTFLSTRDEMSPGWVGGYEEVIRNIIEAGSYTFGDKLTFKGYNGQQPANAINYTCAFRITYQLISYFNTKELRGAAPCGLTNSGAGYAAGIAKFTTRYGSALAVINEYANSTHYKGEFEAVLPALKKVVAGDSDSVDGLDGFCDAWKKAAETSNSFYLTQVNVVRNMYEKPALAAAKQLKIKFPLTRAALTMTAVTNGLGDDGNTLGVVIKATNKSIKGDAKGTSGNSLKIGLYTVDEIEWLKVFLATKDKMSNYATSGNTSAFRNIAENGDLTLSKDITFKGYNDRSVTIRCNKLTA